MATCTNFEIKEWQLDCSTLPHRFSAKPPVKKPSRCSGCCEHFKDKLRSRDCGLCGAAFCQKCTVYRRRICHISGTPYDLGILTNVCKKCFNVKAVEVYHTNHLSEFKKYRREKLEADVGKPVCSRTYAGPKLHKELDRLREGFAATNDRFIKIPEWQKSAAWVEPGKESHCYHCKERFTLFTSKYNCRIGGQVCCSNCIKKEGLALYQDNKGGEPKWGINGKNNGQEKKYRFKTYAICLNCSDNLEAVQVGHIDQKSVFMDRVHEEHQNISRRQTNVNRWLPEYQQEVEAVNLGIRSIEEAEGKLARLHLNLSDTLPAIENHENHLFKLHQQIKLEASINDQKQKLLKNILEGSQSSRYENEQQFCSTNKQLSIQLSREKMYEIQEKRSWESMFDVCIIISKLVANLTKNMKHYKLESTFLEDVENIELAITEELKSQPKRLSLEEHFRAMKEKPSESEIIHMSQMVATSGNLDQIKFIMASQTLTIIQHCSSHLEDETLDLEFQKTKGSLKQAWDKLEKMILIQFNRTASVAV